MSYGPGWKLHQAQQAAKRARTAAEPRQRREKLPPPAAASPPAAPETVAPLLERVEARLDREAEARASLAGTIARLEERLQAAATESAARIATQLAELAKAQGAIAERIARDLGRQLDEARRAQAEGIARLGELVAAALQRPEPPDSGPQLERLASDTAELLRRIPADQPAFPPWAPWPGQDPRRMPAPLQADDRIDPRLVPHAIGSAVPAAAAAPIGTALGDAAAVLAADHVPDAGSMVDADEPAGPPLWGLRKRERAADGGWRWLDRWWSGLTTRIGQPKTTTDPRQVEPAGVFTDEHEADEDRKARGPDFAAFRPCPLPSEDA